MFLFTCHNTSDLKKVQWTHGIGLYGLYKFYEITGDKEALGHAQAWFEGRFDIGTTKVRAKLWQNTVSC